MTAATPAVSTPVQAPPPAPAAIGATVVVPSRSPFLDDPYILERILALTPCLGHFTSHKGAECVDCPVSHECRNTLYARMSKAALKLAAEDAKALKTATSAATSKAPATQAPATQAQTKGGLQIDRDTAQKIEAFEAANCTECGQVIPKGSAMMWADNVDRRQIHVFHIKCFEALPS